MGSLQRVLDTGWGATAPTSLMRREWEGTRDAANARVARPSCHVGVRGAFQGHSSRDAWQSRNIMYFIYQGEHYCYTKDAHHRPAAGERHHPLSPTEGAFFLNTQIFIRNKETGSV